MNIHFISDIHLEFDAYGYEVPEADLYILAGDILVANALKPTATDKQSVRLKHRAHQLFIQFKDKPVIYIPGNHEYYRGNYQTAMNIIQQWLSDNEFFNVRFSREDMSSYRNVGFIYTTLWTDFNSHDPETMNSARFMMNDYRAIENGDIHLTPEFVYEQHKRHLAFIDECLAYDSVDKWVVITHHAPTRLSVHEQYKHDLIMNGAYHSNLEYHFHDKIKLWVHGHIHDSCDYMVGETRVMANPRGYANQWKIPENPSFNPKLIVEI